MSSLKRTKIVFFELCGSATKFTSRTAAEEAAEIYGRLAGYACEVFLCEKCENKRSGVVYHLRGKVRHTSPTGDHGSQFQSSTVSVGQLDRALGTKEEIDALEWRRNNGWDKATTVTTRVDNPVPKRRAKKKRKEAGTNTPLCGPWPFDQEDADGKR